MLTLPWVIDILFETLTPIGDWIWKNTLCTLYLKGWGYQEKPVFFSNLFSGDLYFDALIIGLF